MDYRKTAVAALRSGLAVARAWPVAFAAGALLAAVLLTALAGGGGAAEYLPVPARETERSAKLEEEVVEVPVVAKVLPDRERRRLEREYGVKLAPKPGDAFKAPRKPDPGEATTGSSAPPSAPQGPAGAAGRPEIAAPAGELDLGERTIPPMPRGGWGLGTLDEAGRWQLRLRQRRFAWTGDAGVGLGYGEAGGERDLRVSLWAAPLEWRPAERLPPLVLSGRVTWGPSAGTEATVTLDARLFGRD